MSTTDDLTRLAGIGPAFADTLRAGGIVTFAALAASRKPRREDQRWVDGSIEEALRADFASQSQHIPES
jgi:predicted flap endonuclease-1-like 5' DNA nuclease